MTSINYETISTQFQDRWGQPCPRVFTTRGSLLPLHATPAPEIALFQIVPSTLSDKALAAIRQNTSNPHVKEHILIRHWSTTLPTDLADLPVIVYSDWKGLNYNTIRKHLKKSRVNVVLYDAAILDPSWTHYLGNMTPTTCAALYPKTFRTPEPPTDPLTYNDQSDACTDIEGIVGFAVAGALSTSLDCFVDMAGSKEMVLKKLDAAHYTLVNTRDMTPCYLIERNPDYGKTGSYFGYTGYSHVVVAPPEPVSEITLPDSVPTNTLPPIDVRVDTLPLDVQTDIAAVKDALYVHYHARFQQTYTDLMTKAESDYAARIVELDADITLKKAEYETVKARLAEQHSQELQSRVAEFRARERELTAKYACLEDEVKRNHERELDAKYASIQESKYA
jgi:hypothetical protein